MQTFVLHLGKSLRFFSRGQIYLKSPENNRARKKETLSKVFCQTNVVFVVSWKKKTHLHAEQMLPKKRFIDSSSDILTSPSGKKADIYLDFTQFNPAMDARSSLQLHHVYTERSASRGTSNICVYDSFRVCLSPSTHFTVRL